MYRVVGVERISLILWTTGDIACIFTKQPWIVELVTCRFTVKGILCRQVEEKADEPVSGWLSLQVQVRTHFNSWLYGSSCAIINSNSRESEEGAKLYVIQWESTTANSSVWNLWWSVLEVTISIDQKSGAIASAGVEISLRDCSKSPKWNTLVMRYFNEQSPQYLDNKQSHLQKKDECYCLTLTHCRPRKCSTNFGGVLSSYLVGLHSRETAAESHLLWRKNWLP